MRLRGGRRSFAGEGGGVGIGAGRAGEGLDCGVDRVVVFGVVGKVEDFDDHVREIVGVLACLLAAFAGEEELGEVAESGGATRGDPVGDEGAKDLGEGGVDFVLGGRIAGEGSYVAGEIFVLLGGGGAAGHFGVSAAVAVERSDSGKRAAGAVGIFKLAKVEGIAVRSH